MNFGKWINYDDNDDIYHWIYMFNEWWNNNLNITARKKGTIWGIDELQMT